MTIDPDHDRPESHGLALGHSLFEHKSFPHPLRVNRKVVFLQGDTRRSASAWKLRSQSRNTSHGQRSKLR